MKTQEERLLDEYYKNDPAGRSNAEKRLKDNEPLAYILGETVFYDEYYFVSPEVLIPRPDTERVVEQVIKNLPAGGKLLDLCTGSGCIAISALCHSRDTSAVLVDISSGALEVAIKNAKRNGVSDRCSFICADIQRFSFDGRFDVISSNPPYVCTDVIETLEKECSYEPRIAFDGGRDGMDFYRLLLNICPPMLTEHGKMVFEIGYDQKEAITELCRINNFKIEVFKDYGKNDRVALIDPFTHF